MDGERESRANTHSAQTLATDVSWGALKHWIPWLVLLGLKYWQPVFPLRNGLRKRRNRCWG